MRSAGAEPERGLLIRFCLLFNFANTWQLHLRKVAAIGYKMKTGCRNNEVFLMRWPLAETTPTCQDYCAPQHHVFCSWAHVVPAFRSSLGRKLGHAMRQLGNRGTVVEVFAANLKKSAFIAMGHLPGFLFLWSEEHSPTGAHFKGGCDEKTFFILLVEIFKILAKYLQVFKKSRVQGVLLRALAWKVF